MRFTFNRRKACVTSERVLLAGAALLTLVSLPAQAAWEGKYYNPKPLAYAVLHRRSPAPVIPHGVLRGRTAWALLVSFCVGAALVAIVVNIPLLPRLAHPGWGGMGPYRDPGGADPRRNCQRCRGAGGLAHHQATA